MNKIAIVTLLLVALKFTPAAALEADERRLHYDLKMLKVVDRLTPEQQKLVIDLVEADEFEKYSKEFEKIEQKRKHA